MCNYKNTQVSPYDPISNSGQKFKKTVSLDDIAHLNDEENIVTYVDFDFGVTFYHETATKNRQINRKRIYISRTCEEPKCIPRNDQHNCSNAKQHSFNNFLNPYTSWDMVLAALLSLNRTHDRYSISSKYPQPTTQQPRTDSYWKFSSSRTMDSKSKGLRISFAFFQKNTYQMDEWTKQLLRLKNWVISGNPEQWMEFRRLWWYVNIFNCSYMFCLLDLYCLLFQ